MYLWMAKNRADFEKALTAIKPPNWARVATVLAEEGLTDATGNPPSSKSAYQTWWKVRRDLDLQKRVPPAPQAVAPPPLPRVTAVPAPEAAQRSSGGPSPDELLSRLGSTFNKRSGRRDDGKGEG